MKTNYLLSAVLMLVGLASFSQVNHTGEKSMVSVDKFRLDIINESGYSKQMLVGFASGATLGFDKLYDGKVFGTSPVMLYTYSNDNADDLKLIIQGRPFPTLEKEIVKLGFEVASGLPENNRIQLAKCEGVMVGADILLVDKELGVIHNLVSGPYEFVAIPGVHKDRFDITLDSSVFKTFNINSVKNDQSSGVFITKNHDVLKLSSNKDKIKSIKIYSLCGQLLYSKDFNGVENEIKIDITDALNDMIIIKTVLSNGSNVIKKVSF